MSSRPQYLIGYEKDSMLYPFRNMPLSKEAREQQKQASLRRKLSVLAGVSALGLMVGYGYAKDPGYSQEDLAALPQKPIAVEFGRGAQRAIHISGQADALSSMDYSDRMAVEAYVGEQLAHGTKANVPILPKNK